MEILLPSAFKEAGQSLPGLITLQNQNWLPSSRITVPVG